MHGYDMRFAFMPDVADRISAARQALDLIGRYRVEEASLSVPYAPKAARRIDIDAMRIAWTQAGAKFWVLATPAKRKVAQALAQAGSATGFGRTRGGLAEAGCHA